MQGTGGGIPAGRCAVCVCECVCECVCVNVCVWGGGGNRCVKCIQLLAIALNTSCH